MQIIHYVMILIVTMSLTACVNGVKTEQSQPTPTMGIKKCSPEAAAKLVGQTGLTEYEIKALTQSEIVRMVTPGQAVTMDYRENRITVVLDPQSKVILQASCG